MSAIHTVNGRLQITGTSHDHAVTGWPEPATNPPVFIPKQRPGNAYDTHLLATDGGETR